MSSITCVFPHQLFKDNPTLSKERTVYLIEDPCFFTQFSFHKHKLVLHRASMQYYADFLKSKKYKTKYISLDDASCHTQLASLFAKAKITEVHIGELYDHNLTSSFAAALKKKKIKLVTHDTPYFMTPVEEFKKYFDKKKPSYRLHDFYKKQRKRFNILLTKQGKPRGGSWSLDKENRETLPDDIEIPKNYTPRHNKYAKSAISWVEKKFKKHPGDAKKFWYPTSYEEADRWLKDFLKERFEDFGPYQDAIDKDQSILFHSVLSPIINTGLLTPEEVVSKAIEYADSNKIPLNSLEGFIRQIIGWREFIGGIYLQHGKQEKKENFFKHKRKLPRSFWKASTSVEPIDIVIKRVIETSYAHHIERLMILGNFMLLCQIKPDDVYTWFMELFIDAYDWVMVPNVYGMSQFADGGWFATKPYISSSNYVLKMSNFKKGDWCDIWDGLYWHFIYENKKFFKDQPRLAMMANVLKRMKSDTLKEHLNHARTFLKSL